MRRLRQRRIRGSIYSRPSSSPFRLARPSYTPIEFTSRYTPIEGLGTFGTGSGNIIADVKKNIAEVGVQKLSPDLIDMGISAAKLTGATDLLKVLEDEKARRAKSKSKATLILAGGVLAGAYLLFKK